VAFGVLPARWGKPLALASAVIIVLKMLDD
jgi:hypothetical protein